MTTGKNYLLTIDNGTQSVRALLFDTEGNLVDKTQVMMSTYASPQAGWVENDPEEFWRALCSACQQLWAKTAIPKSAVRALTITTQRATVINLDADGKPLRPAIIWLDQRRATTKSNLPWHCRSRSELDCATSTGNLGAHGQIFAALGLFESPLHGEIY